jgi:hypothetical protein
VSSDVIATLVGALLGALLGYWTNYWFQLRSRPRVKCFGFIWRPGVESRYKHPFDEGDLLKFWFVLNGRSSPGFSSLELVYTPPPSATSRAAISVFAKWDETANPLAEVRSEDDVQRTFFADRVPATYFIPLRNGRIYTIPVVWGTPAARTAINSDNPLRDAVAQKTELLLFSGWWFDPQRPRPYYVPSVAEDGHLKLILNGEGLCWQREFSVKELVHGSQPVERGESDTRQEALKNLLPEHHRWPPRRTRT